MGKSVLVIVVISALIAAAVLCLTIWISARMYDDHQRTCSAIAARVVDTGGSHFVCVASDGRVVGNG